MRLRVRHDNIRDVSGVCPGHDLQCLRIHRVFTLLFSIQDPLRARLEMFHISRIVVLPKQEVDHMCVRLKSFP